MLVETPRLILMRWELGDADALEKCGLRYGGTTDWRGLPHVWYDVRSSEAAA